MAKSCSEKYIRDSWQADFMGVPRSDSTHPSDVGSQITAERTRAMEVLGRTTHAPNAPAEGFVQTYIEGFDKLFNHGIPRGSSVLICGGPGSGKTIFGLHTLAQAAARGEKCLYMTFEESEDRLRSHMRDFGWDVAKLEREGRLKIVHYTPWDIARQVEALVEQSKGELLIDVKPLIFPKGFVPNRVVIDSLSSISSVFSGREESYRTYISQLFSLFASIQATSFFISETGLIPTSISQGGVEEFLADGVILIYNIKHGTSRQSAIEILKMRGESFKRKVVAMEIVDGKGIVVYPDQEVFESNEPFKGF